MTRRSKFHIRKGPRKGFAHRSHRSKKGREKKYRSTLESIEHKRRKEKINMKKGENGSH